MSPLRARPCGILLLATFRRVRSGALGRLADASFDRRGIVTHISRPSSAPRCLRA